MILKQSALKQIRKNYNLRRALMEHHNISEFTLLRWLRENDPNLIKLDTLEIINQYLKTDIDEIILREECDFKPVD